MGICVPPVTEAVVAAMADAAGSGAVSGHPVHSKYVVGLTRVEEQVPFHFGIGAANDCSKPNAEQRHQHPGSRRLGPAVDAAVTTANAVFPSPKTLPISPDL